MFCIFVLVRTKLFSFSVHFGIALGLVIKWLSVEGPVCCSLGCISLVARREHFICVIIVALSLSGFVASLVGCQMVRNCILHDVNYLGVDNLQLGNGISFTRPGGKEETFEQLYLAVNLHHGDCVWLITVTRVVRHHSWQHQRHQWSGGLEKKIGLEYFHTNFTLHTLLLLVAGTRRWSPLKETT